MASEYPKIIGLSGYARSGKDTVAGILHDLYGYERIAFADVLRDCLYALNPPVWVNGHDRYAPVREVVDEMGWEWAKSSAPEDTQSTRSLLQRLGTEVGRDILGENIWVDTAFAKAPAGKLLVVSDVRFPNEFAAIKERGGVVWRLNRTGYTPVSLHPSETALDEYKFDSVIGNNSSVEDLTKTLIAMMSLQYSTDRNLVNASSFVQGRREGMV